MNLYSFLFPVAAALSALQFAMCSKKDGNGGEDVGIRTVRRKLPLERSRLATTTADTDPSSLQAPLDCSSLNCKSYKQKGQSPAATNRSQLRQHRDISEDTFSDDDVDGDYVDADGGHNDQPRDVISDGLPTSNAHIPPEMTTVSRRQSSSSSSGSSSPTYLFTIEYKTFETFKNGAISLAIYFRISRNNATDAADVSSSKLVTIHWASKSCNVNTSYPPCNQANYHDSNKRTVTIGQLSKFTTRYLTYNSLYFVELEAPDVATIRIKRVKTPGCSVLIDNSFKYCSKRGSNTTQTGANDPSLLIRVDCVEIPQTKRRQQSRTVVGVQSLPSMSPTGYLVATTSTSSDTIGVWFTWQIPNMTAVTTVTGSRVDSISNGTRSDVTGPIWTSTLLAEAGEEFILKPQTTENRLRVDLQPNKIYIIRIVSNRDSTSVVYQPLQINSTELLLTAISSSVSAEAGISNETMPVTSSDRSASGIQLCSPHGWGVQGDADYVRVGNSSKIGSPSDVAMVTGSAGDPSDDLIDTTPQLGMVPKTSAVATGGWGSGSGDERSTAVLIGVLSLVTVCLTAFAAVFHKRCQRRKRSFNGKPPIIKSNSYEKSSPSGSFHLLRGGRGGGQSGGSSAEGAVGGLQGGVGGSHPLNVLSLSGAGSGSTVDEWEIDAREVALGVEIGQGAFGRVLTGFYHGNQVAIKVLKDHIPESYREDLLREIALMKGIGHHPNIVTMVGACTTRDPIALIMEYVPYGNLQTFLKKCRLDRESHQMADRDNITYCLVDEATGQKERWHITATDVLSFARQVALAMEYLSERHFVHRDLAARNVLLCYNKICKVCDFGLARALYAGDQYYKLTSGRLPLKWMALESIRDRVFTTSSDVWSFGVLLWEIVTMGSSPYPNIALADIYRLLAGGYRMQQPKNCSDELYDIMLRCWLETPADRPSFSVVRQQLEHLLGRSVDYLDLDNIDAPLVTGFTTSGHDVTSSSGASVGLLERTDALGSTDDDDDVTDETDALKSLMLNNVLDIC